MNKHTVMGSKLITCHQVEMLESQCKFDTLLGEKKKKGQTRKHIGYYIINSGHHCQVE